MDRHGAQEDADQTHQPRGQVHQEAAESLGAAPFVLTAHHLRQQLLMVGANYGLRSHVIPFFKLLGFFSILDSGGAASRNSLCKTSQGFQKTAYLVLTLKRRVLTSPFQCTL